MNRTSGIHRLMALALLMVFMIAGTPKAYFHDLVADHQDDPGCTINHKSVVLHQRQVNCGFDDLVVPVSFLFHELPSCNPLPVCYEGRPSFYSSYLVPPPVLLYESRGPPLS